MTDTTVPTDMGSIGNRIVTEVARTKGVDPVDLEPLYHSIDPELIEGIVRDGSLVSGDVSGQISFPYAGCFVEISGTGTVDVRRHAVNATRESNPSASPDAEPEAPD